MKVLVRHLLENLLENLLEQLHPHFPYAVTEFCMCEYRLCMCEYRLCCRLELGAVEIYTVSPVVGLGVRGQGSGVYSQMEHVCLWLVVSEPAELQLCIQDQSRPADSEASGSVCVKLLLPPHLVSSIENSGDFHSQRTAAQEVPPVLVPGTGPGPVRRPDP